MRIARALYDEMVSHALAEAPNECCGIIASWDGEATGVYPARNKFSSPLRYEIDGEDLIRIFRETDAQGWDWGAVYHSHTRSAPKPSQTDINQAYWPELLYVIVGVAEQPPQVCAYRIVDGSVEEVPLSVE